MEDYEIIQLYLKRDENAIYQTTEKYGARLRAISFNIVRDKETSEECENDTYLEAWNSIPPNKPDNYFFAFLTRIVRALSIDAFRRKTSLKRKSTLVELSEELEKCLPSIDDVEDNINAKILGGEISSFLRTLSDENQVIFVRRYFYMDNVSEISGRLNISDAKVKSSLFRTRNNLRKFLIKEGYKL